MSVMRTAFSQNSKTLGVDPIPAHVVALMYDFGKTIRCTVNPELEDSWLDKEGYTKLGREIITNEP